MENINSYTGNKIRNYRKMKKLTLQQLADLIHKSRATVSKYEKGDISIDLETLFDISNALDIGIEQLVDYHPQIKQEPVIVSSINNVISPFFKAEKLYFYFYDGRYDRLKEAVIDIYKSEITEDGCYEASMTIHSSTQAGRSSETYYTGKVLYSDMLIRFSFLNKYNKLEQDLLYIFNPLELLDMTEGLLCGISSTDLLPCAFKCIVCLNPSTNYDELRKGLQIKNKDLKRLQKLNMFVVDNNG